MNDETTTEKLVPGPKRKKAKAKKAATPRQPRGPRRSVGEAAQELIERANRMLERERQRKITQFSKLMTRASLLIERASDVAPDQDVRMTCSRVAAELQSIADKKFGPTEAETTETEADRRFGQPHHGHHETTEA